MTAPHPGYPDPPRFDFEEGTAGEGFFAELGQSIENPEYREKRHPLADADCFVARVVLPLPLHCENEVDTPKFLSLQRSGPERCTTSLNAYLRIGPTKWIRSAA